MKNFENFLAFLVNYKQGQSQRPWFFLGGHDEIWDRRTFWDAHVPLFRPAGEEADGRVVTTLLLLTAASVGITRLRPSFVVGSIFASRKAGCVRRRDPARAREVCEALGRETTVYCRTTTRPCRPIASGTAGERARWSGQWPFLPTPAGAASCLPVNRPDVVQRHIPCFDTASSARLQILYIE